MAVAKRKVRVRKSSRPNSEKVDPSKIRVYTGEKRGRKKTEWIKAPKGSTDAAESIGLGPRRSKHHKDNVIDELIANHINPSRVPVAREADKGEDPFEDQRVAQCEYLMLRGIEDPYTIKATLALTDVRIVKSYMRRVRLRWKTGGEDSKGRMESARISAIRKLQLLQQKLWDLLDNGHNGKKLSAGEYVRTVETIEKLITRVAEIEGVTKENVIAIIQQSLSIGTESTFHQSQAKTDAMREMAVRFEQLLEENAVDAEYEEVD